MKEKENSKDISLSKKREIKETKKNEVSNKDTDGKILRNKKKSDLYSKIPKIKKS